MTIKLLQLNIEGGRKLDELIDFIKGKDFDIVHLQEVAGGENSNTGNDNFSELKERLGYEGELTISTKKKNDSTSYYGNATLYKPLLTPSEKKVIWLKPYQEYEAWEVGGDFARQLPRNVLSLSFIFDTQQVWFVNTHLAWGPNPYDEQHKVEQGKILYDYVATLQTPFLLSGDFNVVKDSQVVKMIDELATNHTVQAGLTNTLNPRLHRAPQLFPAGLAVDYIYTSRMTARNFSLVDHPDLSDHYGLSIELSFGAS